MKIFREEGTKVADENSSNVEDSQETQLLKPKKRKLDDNDESKNGIQSVAKK